VLRQQGVLVGRGVAEPVRLRQLLGRHLEEVHGVAGGNVPRVAAAR
jgi:hypothetical protein